MYKLTLRTRLDNLLGQKELSLDLEMDELNNFGSRKSREELKRILYTLLNTDTHFSNRNDYTTWFKLWNMSWD